MRTDIFIEPIIILHRPVVPEHAPDSYDRACDKDERDPCVWVLEGPLSSSNACYMRFYATEFCEVLEKIATLDLSENEMIKEMGIVRHSISRTHYLRLKGESLSRTREIGHWRIDLTGSWHNLPHRKIAGIIQSLRSDMPADCVQAWPETRALKGEFRQWLDRALQSEERAFGCNPISIIREGM